MEQTRSRETDQEIKDRQNAELEEARRDRAERLGHDIRDISTPEAGPSKNDLEAAK
jgi:hypothetical protein